jgi:hypothetical protein
MMRLRPEAIQLTMCMSNTTLPRGPKGWNPAPQAPVAVRTSRDEDGAGPRLRSDCEIIHFLINF